MAYPALLLVLALVGEALGAQVHRISTRNPGEKEMIEAFVREHPGSHVWEKSPEDGGSMDVMLQEEHIRHLRQRHPTLDSQVFIPDVTALLELENTQGSDQDFHSKYHSVEEYNNFLAELANKHKNVKLLHVGDSVQGKKLMGVRIGDASKPEILVQGGQHAREWISPGSLAYAAEKLVDAKAVLKDHSIAFVPLVNPDGYTYTRRGGDERMWRKNLDDYTHAKEELVQTLGEDRDSSQCYGTDLNRNWASGKSFGELAQGEEVSNSECSNTYQGSAPFSEKEVQHMAKYIKQRQTQKPGIAAFVDVHSYSQKVIPAGCNRQKMAAGARARHMKLTQAVAKAMSGVHGKSYTSGECAEIMYACSGVAHDWAHFDAGVPNSMAIELRDRGTYGFLVPPSMIKSTGQEMIAAVHSIAQTQRELKEEELVSMSTRMWSEKN